MKRVGVVGAGPMGSLHAEKIQRAAGEGGGFAVASIFDRHSGRAESLAKHVGARTAPSFKALCEGVEALVIATPTHSHFELAQMALDYGLDLLIEKPMTVGSEEGETLVAKARAADCILQVGQLEWYNPAWRRAAERVEGLERIEVDRVQTANSRGRDIDVVADLMLHDLDWTSRWLGGVPSSILARGRCVEGERLDEASAELGFACGTKVRLHASRVSSECRREVRFFGSSGESAARLERAAVGGDPLADQWADFTSAVTSRRPPVNSGEVGVATLRAVERVREAAGAGPRGECLADDSHFSR